MACQSTRLVCLSHAIYQSLTVFCVAVQRLASEVLKYGSCSANDAVTSCVVTAKLTSLNTATAKPTIAGSEVVAERSLTISVLGNERMIREWMRSARSNK